MPQPRPLSPERRRLRAAKARQTQLGADTSQLDAAIRTASLEDHIRRTLSAAPPLSAEQRDRLALLLRPVGAEPRDAA